MKTIDYADWREILRDRYRIPDAWLDLGLEGTPANSCRCPYREDHKPSFSVYQDGKRFKDFASDEKGDVFAFVMNVTGWSFKDAVKWIEDRAGMARHDHPLPRPLPRLASKPSTSRKELKLPDLDEGTNDELRTLAHDRSLWWYAVHVAREIGILRFGTVCGKRSWILLDEQGGIAEARRLDGKPYDAFKTLPERKAHTLPGSRKSWPLGLAKVAEEPHPSLTILLVEGGPDYLAAFDLMARERRPGFRPVAILGKSNKLAPEALDVMAGKRVRIFPHTDGMAAAQGWAEQLADVGCKVDGFTFDGLARRDGRPVSDLNDLLVIPEGEREAWKGVLPQ